MPMWPACRRRFPNNRSAMLSSDDHSGLITFVFGLIIVVFAGIALSLVVDRRFSFSSSVSAMEAEIRSNESELERLKQACHEQSLILTEIGPEREMADAALKDFQKHAVEFRQQRDELVSERNSLRDSIPRLEEDFSSCRRKTREAIRNAAVGELLGTIPLPGGREFLEARITRVTDVGLEIRHAHGTARISSTELGPQFQERFQWDDEERRARLREEQAAREAMERMVENTKAPEKVELNVSAPEPDAQIIQQLRSKVIIWSSRISQLKIERSRAIGSSYGSQASPSGSLETWQARAARLAGEIARAEAELAAAKAALARVSPGDGLLRPRTPGR